MLTKEQERQRALKISKLYFEARKEPRKINVRPRRVFSWSQVVKLSVAFVLPFVIESIIYSFFVDLGYNTISDVQAAGMVFIALLIIIGIWMIFALKRFRDGLGDMVVSSNSIFWLACFFIIPTTFLLRLLFIGNSVKDGLFLIGSSLLFAILATSSSVAIVAFLVRIDIARENE